VGVWLKKVNTSVFSRALWEVTNSQRMIVKAKVLGQKIRKVCFSFFHSCHYPPS
jgi:sterol 3beta-glucosyltransferase